MHARIKSFVGTTTKNQPFTALLVAVGLLAGFISGCVSSPPTQRDNLCELYREKPGWYKASVRASKRWRGPIPVAMAIMYQESVFEGRARPPMRYFLGFIPYGRASNAYGYAQALDSTWASYKKEAGTMLSRRNRFSDAIDFIQWYMHKTKQVSGVSKQDAYAQYLNYHEGQGGYAAGTYKKKAWLINTARKVESRAKRFAAQYGSCKKELERSRKWWGLF